MNTIAIRFAVDGRNVHNLIKILCILYYNHSTIMILKIHLGHKCREDWPSRESEQIFNLFLDVMLLLIPMIIMSMAYSLIMTKLWKGLQREIEHNSTCRQQGKF